MGLRNTRFSSKQQGARIEFNVYESKGIKTRSRLALNSEINPSCLMDLHSEQQNKAITKVVSA